MTPFSELPAFPALLLFSVLLVLKMGAVGFVTANARRKSGRVLNPEDAKVTPGAQPAAEDAPEVQRAKRVHQNDVENIPGFLVLALLFTLTGASATAGWAYFGVYFAARTLHTIFYLRAAQPARTGAFFLGQLAQLGMMVQLLMAAF